MLLLQYFDLYRKKGMNIIPVYRNSKVPVGTNWNGKYNEQRNRDLIGTGRYNLGLLLGDWIDIEGDTDEANELLERMIDGLPHPMYRSNKSIHHLFLNLQGLRTTRFFDIDFRSYGVQSVLPPSVHEEGGIYQWLKGTTFPAPPIPSSLVEFYNQHARCTKKIKGKPSLPKIKEGFIKSLCQICKKKEAIHKKRLSLEIQAFKELQLPWMCHDCREIDVRPACRRIRKLKHKVEC